MSSIWTLDHVDWNKHLNAFLWGAAFFLFGLIVLTFDTRQLNNPRRTKVYYRDRILGLEQRHFVVVLNGVLLYTTLAFFS